MGSGSGAAAGGVALWEACYATPVEADVHVVKGFLDQYGVPCVIEDARAALQPLRFCALGEMRLLVPGEWLHVARGLIAGRRRPARRRRRRGLLRVVATRRSNAQEQE